MAPRPAQLGGGYPRPPHTPSWPVMARPSLPHVECQEPVRSHQASLTECSELRRLKTSSTRVAVCSERSGPDHLAGELPSVHVWLAQVDPCALGEREEVKPCRPQPRTRVAA